MSNAADASKRARREHAREVAREERERERKRSKRNRLFLQGGVGVGILAIVAVVILVIVSTNAPAGPGPKNMASDGIVMTGDGTTISAVTTAAEKSGADPVDTDWSKYPSTVNIVTYIDYQCPYCEQFETANAAQISDWVKAGVVTLEVHPISILDSSSGTNKFSTRAANAAACIAQYDPDKFLDYTAEMYANQPAEGGTGMTDTELKSHITAAGITDSKVADCVSDQTFKDWVKASTLKVYDTSDNGGNVGKMPNSDVAAFSGTPFVTIDGKNVASSDVLFDASGFASAVSAAATAKGITLPTS